MEKDRSRPSRIILTVWCFFIGIGAVLGSVCMFLDTSGGILSMNGMLPYFKVLPFSELLFKDYLFPGIALLIVNGVTNLTAGILLLRRHRLGAPLGTLFGVTLMLWITIQFIIFPANPLSTSYFIFGALQAVTGLCCMMREKQAEFHFDANNYPGIDPQSRTLVIYYSRDGYMKKIAYEEADRLRADIYEIKPLERTEGNLGFWWCGRFAMHRRAMPIEAPNINWSRYDKFVICTPVWVFSVCAPVRAFCEYARGNISSVEYIIGHFSYGNLAWVAGELDSLLNLRAKSAETLQVVFGNVKSRLAAGSSYIRTAVQPEDGATVSHDSIRLHQRNESALPDAVITIVILVIATLVGILFKRLDVNDGNIMMMYILGVLATAIIAKHRIYSIIYSVLCVFAFNYFFTAPLYSFSTYDMDYLITIAIMLTVAVIVATLTTRIKTQAHEAEIIAYRTNALLETHRVIQMAKNEEEILSATALQLVKLYDRTVITYMMGENGELTPPHIYAPDGKPEAFEHLEENSADAARILRESKGQMNGGHGYTFIPVYSERAGYAIIGIDQKPKPASAFERSLADAITRTCALAIEARRIDRTREETELRLRNERTRANLLRAISHDLRTPLTSISGSARVLMTGGEMISEARRQELYVDIYDDALWLVDLVENLLSVTRMESGNVSLNLKSELVDEVIAEAVEHVNIKSGEHEIRVELDDVMLTANMDARLIIQVIVNLINNAIKYTPIGSLITIRAEKTDSAVAFEVADNGCGVSDEQKPLIFDMFYSVGENLQKRRGMGLGLALCRSIVLLHGGDITVRDNVPHGAVFTFTIPDKPKQSGYAIM